MLIYAIKLSPFQILTNLKLNFRMIRVRVCGVKHKNPKKLFFTAIYFDNNVISVKRHA